MMSARRLLISYAHPDDESFGLGGLISYYVDRGVDVYLICATDGDRGTVSPDLLRGYNSVAELRLAELKCAAELLKLRQVFTFHYRDSGMMGAETNNDPDCLWQADQAVVTRRVAEVIREVQPQVVITFNKYGGYGHPDHIAIQRATTTAFQLAGDPNYDTGGQRPYAPQKLYYTNASKQQIQMQIWMARMRGRDPRRLGKNGDFSLFKVLENVEPIHATVLLRDYFDAWERASACHVSQLGGRSQQLPLWLRKQLLPRQGFTRVYPAPTRSRTLEADLFENVDFDELVRQP